MTPLTCDLNSFFPLTFLEPLFAFSSLSPFHFGLVCFVVFMAGVVRGFSGFALSALVMASLASLIPPLELIVVCFFLELSASILMLRNGFREGEVSLAFKLAMGSIVGLFIGLAYSHSVPTLASQFSALFLIFCLAILQLLKIQISFQVGNFGIYASGILAGIASGLASVGGLVIALFVLARNIPARTMRASLVLFLFFTSFTATANFWFYDMFNTTTISRGLIFSVPCFFGVMLGKLLFMPRIESWYRPFCLLLLIFLAGLGIFRLSPEIIRILIS